MERNLILFLWHSHLQTPVNIAVKNINRDLKTNNQQQEHKWILFLLVSLCILGKYNRTNDHCCLYCSTITIVTIVHTNRRGSTIITFSKNPFNNNYYLLEVTGDWNTSIHHHTDIKVNQTLTIHKTKVSER